MFLLTARSAREFPMRTNMNFAVANRSVFGFGQDRVVSLQGDSYAHAAQHLELRHAGKRMRDMANTLKRSWSVVAVAAGSAPKAKYTCLAITGPLRLTVRPTSPVVVAA
jgi:hypothetical protein